jgi:hypothetical protein
MITTKTVFVLGAGASRPYDLPLGNELYQIVIRDLSTNRQIRNDLLNMTPFNESHIDNFIRALKFSGLTSVDAFLEKREEFVDIGKAILAMELLKRESHEVLWTTEQNWMQYLYAKMTTRTLDEFGRNAVSFVTYNYDRTLEQFLHTSLVNSHGKSEEECKVALSQIGIVHLHGRLGYLPWQRDKDAIPFAQNPITPQIIEACLRQIRIVHENIEDRNVEFNQTRRLLWEAKRIYFLGFGWAPQNVERLNFGEIEPQVAEGTAFGVTPGELVAIREQVKGKITFQDMDCLTFLRERGVWN